MQYAYAPCTGQQGLVQRQAGLHHGGITYDKGGTSVLNAYFIDLSTSVQNLQ